MNIGRGGFDSVPFRSSSGLDYFFSSKLHFNRFPLLCTHNYIAAAAKVKINMPQQCAYVSWESGDFLCKFSLTFNFRLTLVFQDHLRMFCVWRRLLLFSIGLLKAHNSADDVSSVQKIYDHTSVKPNCRPPIKIITAADAKIRPNNLALAEDNQGGDHPGLVGQH